MGSTAAQIGLLLVNTLAGFYMFIVVLRFLLQAVRADFHNPISQFVVKATTPVLVPIRKMVPGFGGYDIAALVLLYILQCLAITASIAMVGWPIEISNIAVWALLGSAGLFLKLYFWGLLIMIILSWVAPQSYNPAVLLLRQIIEPVMEPIRKRMPDMGGLDLSPMVIMLSIMVLEIIMKNIAVGTGAPGFIIGL